MSDPEIADPSSNERVADDEVKESKSFIRYWWDKIMGSSDQKFGTWDGVFVSCLMNIIGVILFARMGFIVGNTGIWQGIVLILLVTLMSLVTILSTAGVCSTCHLTKGGVYAIIKQALGTQFGGTVGIVYVMGLAIVNAVFILGFAEAMIDICNWPNDYANNVTVGLVTEVVLLIIVLCGVSWVIKLQFLLLLFLVAAIFNFIIGGFITPTFNDFFTSNLGAGYTENENFFTMFGLFFASTTGIMAGANMSGDLRTPSVSIPIGTIAAVAVTNSVYLLFIFILASAVSREDLLTQFLIAQKISGTEVLFFIGLFIASLSSSLGVFIGAPRVLQGIGEDVPVFGIKQMAVGWGKSADPIRATFFIAIITAGFIIIGDLNTVAPVMTVILLLTYAAINYSYFALATGGLREEAEAKQREMLETMEMDNIPQRTKKQAVSFKPPPRWVLVITNRWVSLLFCVWHIVAMFLIQWWLGLIVIGVEIFFYIYIGLLNKDQNLVGDADFSLREWINPLHHPSRKGQRERDTPTYVSSDGPSNVPDESDDPYAEEKAENYTPANNEL